MGYDRVTVTTPIGKIAPGDVVVWTFNGCASNHSRVVWYVEGIVGHEQIEVTIFVYYFGSFAGLPARRGFACANSHTISGC